MKEWLETLEKREQNLVLMLGAMLMVALVYFVVYQPLANNLNKAQQGVASEQKLLVWVEKNATKIAKLRAQSGLSASPNQGSLAQIINTSARRHKLTINRIQPQNNKIQINIESASFVALLQWVQELELTYSVLIEIAEFRPQGAPGYVKTRLVVSK